MQGSVSGRKGREQRARRKIQKIDGTADGGMETRRLHGQEDTSPSEAGAKDAFRSKFVPIVNGKRCLSFCFFHEPRVQVIC